MQAYPLLLRSGLGLGRREGTDCTHLFPTPHLDAGVTSWVSWLRHRGAAHSLGPGLQRLKGADRGGGRADSQLPAKGGATEQCQGAPPPAFRLCYTLPAAAPPRAPHPVQADFAHATPAPAGGGSFGRGHRISAALLAPQTQHKANLQR